MAVTLEDKLVVAISSRALFDFEEENRLFDEGDDAAYVDLQRKRLDMICANRVGLAGSGFESDDNALLVIDAHGERALGPASKAELAAVLLDIIGERLQAGGTA